MLSNRSHDVLHAFSMAIEMWRASGNVSIRTINFATDAVAKGAAFETRLKAIEADRNLSGAGVLHAKNQAATTFIEELEAWAAGAFNNLKAAGDKIRKEMQDAIAPAPFASIETDPSKSAAAAGIRAEYRAIADTLDANEVMLMYINGDRTIRAALDERQRVTGGNGGVWVRPYVTDDVRESALVETARHTRPELAKALKENADEDRMAHEAVDTIKTLVRSLVPSGYVPEPIQPVAGAIRVLA